MYNPCEMPTANDEMIRLSDLLREAEAENARLRQRIGELETSLEGYMRRVEAGRGK